MCVNACAEPPSWLEDWYEIEVIIFVQPDESIEEDEDTTLSPYAEDLIVPAPVVVEGVSHAFSLTDAERTRLRDRSNAVDLSQGSDPWFTPPNVGQRDSGDDSSNGEIAQYGTFPAWMLPPGHSYDPHFIEVFGVVPFGDWFSSLALSSLIDEENEENDTPEGEATSDSGVTEGSEEELDEPELTREEVLAQIDTFREELERTSYIMDERNVRLPRTAERLRSKGVHVIKHFNWHQYVPSLVAKPQLVFFQSLSDYPTEGIFGVSKGRFIHFDVHIWIHQPQHSSTLRFPVYELAELRRMQREDVHYFDHPRFGILAEVVKIDLPSDLQELWDSLY